MIGIVILNYMLYEKTIECVSSITKNRISEIYIYIIDNASQNESYNYLSQKYKSFKNIKVLKTDKNLGYARGNNFGIKEAMKDGIEYIILTNNDIIFKESAIQNLYEFIQMKEDAVIVGPRIYTPNGLVQHSSLLEKNSFYDVLGLYILDRKTNHLMCEDKIQNAMKVYSVSGCCFIISASKFKSMGAFDENTFLYNEENILGCQAKEHKYNIYFLPSSHIVHDHGATTGKQNLFVSQELLISTLYYWRTYRNGKKIDLFCIFLIHTIKNILKSLYISEYRKGWKCYFVKTLKALKKTINNSNSMYL